MAVRILLIDDNLPDRVRYRRMLQRAGGDFEIEEAEDGASGLARLDAATEPFACILLDQDLPDLQGLDLLEDIRERPGAPPVVMLTGEEDAAVSIQALRRGAADYLMKRRIDEDRLPRAVLGAIDRATLEHQLREQQQRLARFYRLASQTEDALFIVDGETLQIIECNEAARARLGLGCTGSAEPTKPAAFASPSQWLDFCQRALADGSASYEWYSAQPDGGECVIEILARSLDEDGRFYIFAVGREITLRKQYERALVERSLRDGLTGVWNRRAFDERLAEAWTAAARKRQPLAVVLLDVDHFKAYNDALGHLAGDECLRQIAQALRSGVLRADSMLARYGGEEFVALIEDADSESARTVAERMRQTVLTLALPHPDSDAGGAVTISAGVASLIPDAEQHMQQLVTAADVALYRAKQNGRNRVIVNGD